MPAKPISREASNPNTMVKVTFSLDLATLDRIDQLIAETPDISSRSAAIRKLARERIRRPRATEST